MDNFGLKDLVKRNKREGKFCPIIPLFCLIARCKVLRLFSRSFTLNSAIKVKVIRRQVFPRRRYGDGVGEGVPFPTAKSLQKGANAPLRSAYVGVIPWVGFVLGTLHTIPTAQPGDQLKKSRP